MRRQDLILILIAISVAGCQSLHQESAAHKAPSQQIRDRGKPREVMASNITFDGKTGEIRYTLPEAALVRLRIGMQNGGPFLRNLLDWEERSKGEHVEVWDKKDVSGKIEFSGKGNYLLVLSCIPVEEKEWPRDSKTTKGFRKAPKFKISFPESSGEVREDVAIVKGDAPVRISLDPDDQKWLTETKYEVALYIDYTFLLEDEEGSNPFTYRLKTENLNDGPHTITVNIATFEGEAATQSAIVMVKNK